MGDFSAPNPKKICWTYSLNRCLIIERGDNMKQSFSVSITEENGIYVAQCLEVDIASQGDTPQKALENLQEALELYFEDPQPSVVPEVKKIEVEVSAT